MNFPSLPTDNLYKFMAIAGLAIITATVYFFLTTDSAYNQTVIISAGEIKKLDQEESVLATRRKMLRRAIERLERKVGVTSAADEIDSVIVYPAISEGPPNLIAEAQAIEEMIAEYVKQRAESNKIRIEVETRAKLGTQAMRDAIAMERFLTITMGIGGALVAYGFTNWIRTQRRMDAVLRAQAAEVAPKDGVCESCGMNLAHDPQRGREELDGRRSVEYCSHCYDNGGFREAGLTLKAMKTQVRNRAREQGFGPVEAWVMSQALNDLKRWRRAFSWEVPHSVDPAK